MKIIDRGGKQPIGWALHAAGAATVALVCGAYYYFVYQSLATSEVSDSSRIEQLTLLLSESAAIQRENHNLQQDLDALEASVAEIRKRLPHELRQEEFTADLSRVAESVGLEVENLRWGSPQVTAAYAQTEIEVDCSGSFASFCRFLDEVGQLARITDVAQLQLEGDAESASHTFQVSFVLYYRVAVRQSDKNDGVL
jgi:type IV pilus assembly protein PilO